MPFRITTWNVNGIRNPFGYQPWRDKRTFDGMFDVLEADIVIMQELKIQQKDLRDDMVLVPGFDCFFSLPIRKKGYSGVGIYTRQSKCSPIRAEEGVLGVLPPPNSKTAYCDLPEDQHIGGYLTPAQLAECGVDPIFLDSEGRCVVLEFPAFVLFGVYSPANSNGLRDDFRYGFLNALDMRIRNLIKAGKNVVLCGDLNVSRDEQDTANADEAMRKEGITHDEYISTPNRRIFNQLLEGGEVVGERDEGREGPVLWDTTRAFHPERQRMFTHWEQKINARPGNFGSRIDFVLTSLAMKDWVCEANIQEGLYGSDHCPVYAVFKDEVEFGQQRTHLADIVNPPGYFQSGKRLKQVSSKDSPAFSGRLLPEFDKRRSIKDMFTKRPTLNPSRSSTAGEEPALNTEEAQDTNGSKHEAQALPAGSQLSSTASQIALSPCPSPERKRSAPTASTQPSKKPKTGQTSSSTAASTRGQQSLKGFFKPAPSPKKTGEAPTPKPEISTSTNQTTAAEQADEASRSEPIDGDFPAFGIEAVSPNTVHDPIVSKESWSKMFAKPRVPLCESHEEPCKVMKTKKPGFNCGREFYMCARYGALVHCLSVSACS